MVATLGRGPGIWVGVLFLLFWSAMCLLFDGFLAWMMYHQIVALGYPRVPGTIKESKVSLDNRPESGGAGIFIQFVYTVDGQQYTGDRYRYGEGSSDDRHAYDVVEALPAGTEVQVHYNPDNPSDSCLQAGVDGFDLFFWMFMTPFNTIMVLGWGYLLADRRWARKPAGGAAIRKDDSQTRVRLSGLPAPVAGILTAGALSFLLIFVVGFFGGGFHPPLGLMILVWGFILFASIAVTGRTARRNALGLRDLVIDEEEHTVTLPPSFGRKEPMSLPFRAISGVEVEDRTKSNTEGQLATRFAPTLIIASQKPRPHRETLAQWTDQARAEDFADWLRKKLRLGD